MQSVHRIALASAIALFGAPSAHANALTNEGTEAGWTTGGDFTFLGGTGDVGSLTQTVSLAGSPAACC